jgi:ferrous iron transport protein A
VIVTSSCFLSLPSFFSTVAPLGDPIEITVRDYELSLRKGDAELIEIDV